MQKRFIIVICFFVWGSFPTGVVAVGGTHDQLTENIVRSTENTTDAVSNNREGIQTKSEIHIKSFYPEKGEKSNIALLFRNTDIQNFDIPIVFNDAVEHYIKYFTQEKRKVFGNWLRRSRQYVPLITEILREQNMPEDLVYLAMIESGFNPKAYSHAKASGPWQFIHETGGRYGLKVNRWVDERRDPEKSTVAAAKYLRDLFSRFDCWYLAAAGYNAGENRVARAMRKHDTNDFWEIYKYNALPRETRNYIPQLIAAAIIAKEPEKYGFDSIPYDAPSRSISMSVPPSTPLSLIANVLSIDLNKLTSFNPELLRGITPPGKDFYEIKLPGSINKQQFTVALKNSLAETQKAKSIVRYRVRQNDTLVKIAKGFGLGTNDIRLANNWKRTPKLKTGMTIVVPAFTDGSTTALKEETEVTFLETKNTGQPGQKNKTDLTRLNTASMNETMRKRNHHTVRRGDTLASISDRYSISIVDLKSINRLKNDRLQPNTKLKLVSYSEKQELPKVKYHTVRKGESLSSLSNKYGISIEDIRSINRLRHNNIQVGMKIKVVLNTGR